MVWSYLQSTLTLFNGSKTYPLAFFYLVVKNRLPMNGADKTVDHNTYSKICAQQGQTAQKKSQWEKKSYQQSPSWNIKKEEKYSVKYIMKYNEKNVQKITIFSIKNVPSSEVSLDWFWSFKVQHLTEGGICFKVRRGSSIKFENVVIFIFLIIKKLLSLSYIVLYIPELLVIVILSFLVYLLYLFRMHFNLVTTTSNFYQVSHFQVLHLLKALILIWLLKSVTLTWSPALVRGNTMGK